LNKIENLEIEKMGRKKPKVSLIMMRGRMKWQGKKKH